MEGRIFIKILPLQKVSKVVTLDSCVKSLDFESFWEAKLHIVVFIPRKYLAEKEGRTGSHSIIIIINASSIILIIVIVDW